MLENYFQSSLCSKIGYNITDGKEMEFLSSANIIKLLFSVTLKVFEQRGLVSKASLTRISKSKDERYHFTSRFYYRFWYPNFG